MGEKWCVSSLYPSIFAAVHSLWLFSSLCFPCVNGLVVLERRCRMSSTHNIGFRRRVCKCACLSGEIGNVTFLKRVCASYKSRKEKMTTFHMRLFLSLSLSPLSSVHCAIFYERLQSAHVNLKRRAKLDDRRQNCWKREREREREDGLIAEMSS